MEQKTIFDFKKEFNLDTEWSHLGLGILAPHSNELNRLIDGYRLYLDNNPDEARRHRHYHNQKTLLNAGKYLGVDNDEIILTESTTLSLSLVYMGFKYSSGDEILMSQHEHYSVDVLGIHAIERFGVKVKKFNLFENMASLTEDEIVLRYINNISDKTRLISITWVNSCFGFKLPVKKITDAVKKINLQRCESRRIFTVLDAVHGIGIENIESLEDFGVDFVASGCHKWLFGPRGTGFLWASSIGWDNLSPLIPSFESECWDAFMGNDFPLRYSKINRRSQCIPGGFRNFEYQWALSYAFENMLMLGKENVESYIHNLNGLAKNILIESKKITLYTPLEKSMSSGFVCFNIKGVSPVEISNKFKEHKIMLGYTPYKDCSLRIAPGLLNTEEEVIRICNMLVNI